MRKIKLRDIEEHDRRHCTSHKRKLEMVVDSLVSFDPAYAGQFWYDCRIYSLSEARTYLVQFVQSKVPDGLEPEMAEFSGVVETILNKVQPSKYHAV